MRAMLGFFDSVLGLEFRGFGIICLVTKPYCILQVEGLPWRIV